MKVFSAFMIIAMVTIPATSREQHIMNKGTMPSDKRELKSRLVKSKKCDGKLESLLKRIEVLEASSKREEEEKEKGPK